MVWTMPESLNPTLVVIQTPVDVMASTLDFSTSLGHGIWAIDTGYQQPDFDAAYLMVEDGRAAFIDCGTTHSLPRFLAALDAAGVARDAVDWVIPTHVHLDHAGGAGALMAALPSATLLVHPRGARHLIDPSKLIAGASAVYGADVVRDTYGEIVPVPAERVVESHDEMTVHLAGRPLRLIDTPGHARHHHCIWDERSRGFFSGDTFGLSYRELDTPQGPWIFPTTSPVQFDPPALRASVERMLAQQPECMYLTHYSRVDNVQKLGRDFLEQLDAMIGLMLGLASQVQSPDERHEALKRGLTVLYVSRLRSMGSTLPTARVIDQIGMDIELNAQGMAIWMETNP